MLSKMSAEIKLVDDKLKELFSEGYVEIIKPAYHLIKSGGKRIRPLLCILSCEACGGSKKDAIEPACAIELLHTFTLIHDDIIYCAYDPFLLYYRGKEVIYAKAQDQ